MTDIAGVDINNAEFQEALALVMREFNRVKTKRKEAERRADQAKAKIMGEHQEEASQMLDSAFNELPDDLRLEVASYLWWNTPHDYPMDTLLRHGRKCPSAQIPALLPAANPGWMTGKDYRRHLATMSYARYLQTEHWKAMSKRIRARDGNRCVECGSDRNLVVHHKTYERRGMERFSDLVTLCGKCHAEHHHHKALDEAS